MSDARPPAVPRLVLASASPRRLALLRQIGFEPGLVQPTDIDEHPLPGELPRVHAERLASEKANAAVLALQARGERGPYVVLAADTVVASGRRILPKAMSVADVEACLSHLSGRRHAVITALVAVSDDGRARARTVSSFVKFKRLSSTEIARYCAHGEGLGKAGGYAIQGAAAAFVPWFSGSYSNIVGLPVYEAAQVLSAFGLAAAPQGRPDATDAT